MAYEIPLNECTYSKYYYKMRTTVEDPNVSSKHNTVTIVVLNMPVTRAQVRAAGESEIQLTGGEVYNDIYMGSAVSFNTSIPYWMDSQDNVVHGGINGSGDYFKIVCNPNDYFASLELHLTSFGGLTEYNYGSTSIQKNLSDTQYCIPLITIYKFSDDDYVCSNWNSIYPITTKTNSNKVASTDGWSIQGSGVPMFARYSFSIDDNDATVEKWVRDVLGASSLIDDNDPNEGGGSSGGGNSSGGGTGGDGTIDIGGSPIDGGEHPTITPLDSGLLTCYNPTVTELQNLGKFLWKTDIDFTTIQRMTQKPLDLLLGLSVVPIKPTIGGTKTIMFGNLDSGVSAGVVSDPWRDIDCGTFSLNEVWRGSLDYSPGTSVSIYLPFIGTRQLNTNDVMGSTLKLIYHFDVLTGGVEAEIHVNHTGQGNKTNGFSYGKDMGKVYDFVGSCAVNIPLASQDFTNTIRAMIGAVGVVGGAAASVATGNAALGVATLAAGTSSLGIQANTPTVQRSGHLSGSAAFMAGLEPGLIVQRPHQCKPTRYYALRGIPSQVYTSKLSECTGFTQVVDNNNIHCSGASDSELQEIENLLASGVYFPDKKR